MTRVPLFQFDWLGADCQEISSYFADFGSKSRVRLGLLKKGLRREQSHWSNSAIRFRRMTGQVGGSWHVSAAWGVAVEQVEAASGAETELICAASGPSAVGPSSGER